MGIPFEIMVSETVVFLIPVLFLYLWWKTNEMITVELSLICSVYFLFLFIIRIVVGISTVYGLEGPGIKSRWVRDFSYPSRPALVSTQPPIQWGPFPALKRPGVALTNDPNLSPKLQE